MFGCLFVVVVFCFFVCCFVVVFRTLEGQSRFRFQIAHGDVLVGTK